MHLLTATPSPLAATKTYSMKMHSFGKLIELLLFIPFLACNLSSNSNAHKSDISNTSEIAVDLPHNFKKQQAESLSVSAHDLAMHGKFEQAIEIYLRAIDIEKDNPKLYFDLAESYSHIQAFQKAIAALNKAIALDSLYPPFYNNRGLYNYNIYNDEAAISDYKAAIMLDSTEGVYFVNLAITYNSLNRTADACIAYQKAKSLGLDLNNYKEQKDFIKLIESCR